MAERTATEQELEIAVKQADELVVAQREVAVQQQRVAEALSRIADALSPAALNETLTGFAKAQAVGQIVSAMIGATSKNGLDARNYGRIEVETAHLLSNVFSKVMDHLSARGKGEVDPETRDAEKNFTAWLEGRDPGDETDEEK